MTDHKTYVPGSPSEIRDQILTDIRLECINIGIDDPPVQEGTDWHILATAVANASTIQLGNLRIDESERDVLDASGDALDQIRESTGLPAIPPTRGSGRVDVVAAGVATIPAGAQLVLPNGQRLRTVGPHAVTSPGGSISVEAVDPGSSSDAAAGTVVRFISPPVNVAVNASVSTSSPISGGTDDEDDDRKRRRILNRKRNVVAGGSWAHVREIALNTSSALRDCYVYPALGGPGTAKAVVVKRYFPDVGDFSPVATVAQIDDARAAIYREFPSPMELIVQTVDPVDLEPTVRVALPESAALGGNGLGWVDDAPWPPLEGGDGGRVRLTNVAGSAIEVSAVTATNATPGVTTIAWWSSVDQEFVTRKVLLAGGVPGAWVLILDAPLVDSNGAPAQIGDYISPAVVRADQYGATWRELAEGFGPHENTSDAFRLPRSLRHPYAADESPAQLTTRQLSALQSRHPEIADIEWGYTTTLTVPGAVKDPPQCFRPRHFGIYRK